MTRKIWEDIWTWDLTVLKKLNFKGRNGRKWELLGDSLLTLKLSVEHRSSHTANFYLCLFDEWERNYRVY